MGTDRQRFETTQIRAGGDRDVLVADAKQAVEAAPE